MFKIILKIAFTGFCTCSGVVCLSSHLISLIVNFHFVITLCTAVSTFAGNIKISCGRFH